MAHSRLSDPEYKNWVIVGVAIQITRDGLKTIVQNAVDKYHSWLLATLPNNVKAWRQHLTNAHRSNDKTKITWKNSVHTKWLSAGGSWEMAKTFMAPLGKSTSDVVNAQTTDISGLMNILEWSPRGLNGMFNTGVDLSKLAYARHSRNIWAHSPQLHINDVEKADAFASFTSLLHDPELSHDKDVHNAINELNHLRNGSIAVIEEDELKALVELQRQLYLDLESLRTDITGMTCWKDQVDAKLEDIENLMKSLDDL